MSSIAANIIVRNESHRLENLLKILRPIMDEIVVVDQESTDNTVDIVKKYTNLVFSDKCTGQADSSRQLAMDKTSAKWILTIDADEFPTNRLIRDIPLMIRDRLCFGYSFCLCQLYPVDTYKEIERNIDKIMSYGYSIDIPHASTPNRYRLYRHGHVQIDGILHSGIRPKHGDLIRYYEYNAIVEAKTKQEAVHDIERYTSIVKGTFNP